MALPFIFLACLLGRHLAVLHLTHKTENYFRQTLKRLKYDKEFPGSVSDVTAVNATSCFINNIYTYEVNQQTHTDKIRFTIYQHSPNCIGKATSGFNPLAPEFFFNFSTPCM
jgi:hypothetical protein